MPFAGRVSSFQQEHDEVLRVARVDTTLKRRYTVIDAAAGLARLPAEGDADGGFERSWWPRAFGR